MSWLSAEAWLQRTSLFSMTRLGTDSAQAPSDSLMLRFVWKALVPRASFATWINPVYTDREVPLTDARDVVEVAADRPRIGVDLPDHVVMPVARAVVVDHRVLDGRIELAGVPVGVPEQPAPAEGERRLISAMTASRPSRRSLPSHPSN